MTYDIKAAGRTHSGYESVTYPDRVEGDNRPIFHDAARINLSEGGKSFAVGFRRSKNPFGKEVKFADVVDLQTGDVFSLAADTIFYAKIVKGDPKIILKSGNELFCFADFGRTEYKIEPDGDKAELTPLGYYDSFVRFDDDYYYPLVFDPKIAAEAEVKHFYDYYGFRAYSDDDGATHFLLCYEDETSTEERWVWYFSDNFKRCSERIDFGDDSEIETWDVDSAGTIRMVTTENKKFHIDASGKVAPGHPDAPIKNEFVFERFFEDTDSDSIVGKNEKGLFVVNRRKTVFTENDKSQTVYYAKLLSLRKDAEAPVFLFEDFDGIVTIVDHLGFPMAATDIVPGTKVTGITVDRKDGEALVSIEGESVPRRYGI